MSLSVRGGGHERENRERENREEVEGEKEQEKEDLKRDLAHSLATLNGSGILPCKVNLRRI